MQSALPTRNLHLDRTGIQANLRAGLAFLMLGGASWILLLLFALLAVPQVVMHDDLRLTMQEVSSCSLLFVLLFSYPHFVFSYRFAYMQGIAFVVRHNFQLIVYPLGLAGLLAASFLFWNLPVERLPWLLAVDRFWRAAGFDFHWSQYNGLGQLLLSTLLIAQMIMSGFHYCMQGFGVALTCGRDRRYILSGRQRLALKVNLYALWAMNLFSGYSFFSLLNSRSFAYHAPQFPRPLYFVSNFAFAISALLLVYAIFAPVWRRKSSPPPFMAVVPIVSLWIWLQPFVQPYGYQFWVVPLAHGAQYLYFCYRVEARHFDSFLTEKLSGSAIRQALFYLGLVVATISLGYLGFIYVPSLLDRNNFMQYFGAAPNFFFLAAFVFFSTHHYVLDSVAWKPDSRARKLLSNCAEPVSTG